MSKFSLRGIYDEVERRITPPVEAVVHSEEFVVTLKMVGRARNAIGGRIDAAGAAVLHAVNLPAGSDVRKLRRQIGDLDYEVRSLRRELAATEQPGAPAEPSGPPAAPATPAAPVDRQEGDDGVV